MGARRLFLAFGMLLVLTATVPAMASAHIIVVSGRIGCAPGTQNCACFYSKDIWGPSFPIDFDYLPGGPYFDPTDPEAIQHIFNSQGSVTLNCDPIH